MRGRWQVRGDCSQGKIRAAANDKHRSCAEHSPVFGLNHGPNDDNGDDEGIETDTCDAQLFLWVR